MKKKKGICCAMVVKPKEETKEKDNIPPKVQTLLERYHDIVDNGYQVHYYQ